MERLVLASVEQNEGSDDLYVFHDDAEFTHYQDKGIWKEART